MEYHTSFRLSEKNDIVGEYIVKEQRRKWQKLI